MNREEIIRIAQEAGLHIATDVNWMPIISLECAERFAGAVLSNIDPSSFMSYQEGYEAGKSLECVVCVKDKQDAERYRHMRNNAQFQSRNGPGLYWYLPRFSDGTVRDEGKQLDDAIDAAIRARGQA